MWYLSEVRALWGKLNVSFVVNSLFGKIKCNYMINDQMQDYMLSDKPAKIEQLYDIIVKRAAISMHQTVE